MIANILSTVIGLVLVYAAVLNPSLVSGVAILFIAGIIIIALAVWARASDAAVWFSQTNGIVGVCVIVLAVLQLMKLTSPLIAFWGLFWCGVIIGVVALWAALYRAKASQR